MTTLIDLQMTVDTSSLDAAQIRLQQLGESARGFTQAQQTMGAETTKTTAAISSMTRETEKVSKSLDGVAKSHAGVNRELLVLAHELSQGNYTKFGGSMLVLGERTDALGAAFRTLAPLGVAGGLAVAAVGLAVVGTTAAIVVGAMEQAKFNRDLKLTGDYAGVTASSFRLLSNQISNSTNATIGSTKEVLNSLVAAGTFGPRLLEPTTVAILAMERVSGQSAAAVVKDFSKMADGVLKWADEHNKQYHFITLAQHDYIRVLEETGKTEEAQLEVSRLLTEHLGGAHVQNLGYAERAWEGVKRAVSGAVDAMKNVGKTADTAARLATAQGELESAKQGGAAAFGNASQRLSAPGADDTARYNKFIAQKQAEIDMLNQTLLRATENASNKAYAAYLQEEGIKGDATVRSIQKGIRNGLLVEEKIAEYRSGIAKERAAGKSDSAIFGDSSQAKDEALIRKKYGARQTKVTNTDSQLYKAELAELDGFIKDKADQYKLDVTLTETLLAKGVINQEQARKQIHDLHVQELKDDEEFAKRKIAEAEKIVAKTKGKQGLAELERFKEQLKHLRAEEVQADADYVKATEVSASKLRVALSQMDEALKKSMDARQLQADRASNKLSMTSTASAEATAQEAITDKYIEQSRKLQDAFDNQKLSAAALTEQIKKLQEAESAEHAQESKIAAKRQADQGDFSQGWTRAFNQFQEDSKNYSKQGGEAFNKVTSTMQSGLTQFVTTGKLDFKAFAVSIIADLAKIAAEKLIAGIAGSLFGAGSSGEGMPAVAGYSPASTYANGGAFNAGTQFFAKGDVFSSPTSFGMSNGKTGVMGEAGPEAIIPLKRGADGKLGIGSSGSSQPNNTIVNNNMSVSIGSVDSEERQAALMKAMRDQMVSTANQVLAAQLRPGGQLQKAIGR